MRKDWGSLCWKMQSVALEAVEHPCITTWKVHHLSCLELKKIIEKITEIFAAIDSARPRCKAGLQALCVLHLSIEKCMVLLRCCSEYSKLYLALSGETIISRCERIRFSLESCLSLLQNMVEPTLAVQISEIVDYLRTVAFTLDSLEDEAGQALLALLHQDIAASNSANVDEIKAFKFAAFRLQITSPMAIFLEKRSLRKLLSKTGETNPAKTKILKYLLYLLIKYGKSILAQRTETIANEKDDVPEGDDDVFGSLELPVKFKSPGLNKLSSSCSGSSLSSSLGDLHLQVDNVSFRSSDTNSLDYGKDADTDDGFGENQEKCQRFKCAPSTGNGANLFILLNLSALPWPSRRKTVEDLKNQLKDDQESHRTISTSYIKPVFKFLKEAHQYGDSGAKKHGAELLLMFLKECRTDVPPLPKEAMCDLFLFLVSENTEEALPTLEVLSCQERYSSAMVASGILLFILEIIKNPKSKHHNAALRVLCNLSAHTVFGHHLIYLGLIQHLVPFLDDLLLSGYCVKILRNLCTIEEAMPCFLENESCVVSIGELVEVGKDEEQEHAIDILLVLCYQREELHEVLLETSVISSLVDVSQNGSSRGKSLAVELLQLLNNVPESRILHSELPLGHSGNPRAKNSCCRSSGFFGRIRSRFRKPAR